MKSVYIISEKIICIASLVLAYSCNSFVEVELPKSQLTNTAVFEEFETADAAITDIYSSLRTRGILTGSGSGISNQLGNYADELISIEKPSNSSLFFYNNTLLPSNSQIALYWNTSYSQIYAANSIIEGVRKSSNLSNSQKNQLLAEAVFIRAILHFYLANLFGDVPYITVTDYKTNSTVRRTPVSKIYEFIIKDLSDAEPLLPANYDSSERVRPNKYSARAFLARVYLYNRSYSEASDSASAVINQSGLYELNMDLSKVFLIASSETIWQLQSGNAGTNTLEGSFFIFSSGPPSLVSLSSDLAESFSNGDMRRLNWIKPVGNSSATWYHANKYKEKNTTSSSKEYSILFRLAEMYLIRSEARAQQGDLIGAKEDLNKIRNRAGLPNSGAITKAEILNAIILERKWELFTEFGHRFFDLKRTGRLDTDLGYKIGWDTTDSLFPIPESELNTNPNLLPQNQGY
ncbi:RagB/SusD family nutrient uptake outer membrane protein [Flavobacterium defluvii]|uniref:RagB/SusD domain-containing protein n=1 Tax=Flavobacterium defluvii TaxID=370979 RepID=A0A1M5JCV4_9FLAO|nr:RagB/SusD family nutrient uptake outer membrane protein [Flavobacterium defluvii]SHG38331.1 RagB/SusD domain-containing protein [Flavobacterium defluvii]